MSNVSKEIAIELVEDGQAGNGIVSVTRTYGISASGTTASDTTSPSDITTWSAGSPTVTTAKPYLWVKEITVYTETPDTTKYYCVGKRGDNGIDAKDVEWAYIRTTTPTPPAILNDSTYTDSNSKTYTADGHLPRVDSTNRTDIEKENSGSSSKYYECTDDPKGVNDTWKYEWEIKRTKGNVGSDGSTRAWNYYTGSMTLHNNYAESAFIIDIDNDNDQFGTDSDSKVLVEQTRSTTVTLYDGATPQTLKSLTVALKYENGTTNVPTSVATYTADKDTGKVDVTVKVNNTPNSHTEIQAHITATDTNDRQKTIVFALYKVMGGAPGLTPIIYNVAATDKVFSFQRTDANALTPSSRTSQINVARTEGNTTTILYQPQSGLTFSWGFDDESTAQASSQSIGDSIEITSTDATSHSSVWVELSTGDRETLAIVKDGAKGNSGTNVEAQYAPNSSPTSSQIHTTFQNGDKYMRTRSGSGSWSGWQKIVGENGAETDFTFNISKNKTSTNASTSPANCYYSEWQDAPIAVTTTYPYLWAKVVQKNGDGTVQSTRYIRLTGEDGKSVLAQYSVDGSSNWHTTFATGDEWMRTSDNGGTSWSAAMKIVGEDGDSTNFEFGISQYQTADGAPSDISTWSDAPIATTSSKPYLWSKVTTPDGTVSYIRLTGEKGASITKSSEVNTYKVSDSGTTTPTGTWYSTKAAANNAYAWSANRYMWTKTVITWSDSSTTTLYSAERNPDDGDAGMSIVIASQSVTYSKQTSGNLDPTTLTYGSYPSSLSKGDWLYSKTTVNYETSEGASAGSTSTYSVSYIGTDGVGQAGRGITGVYEHYKASANSTGETTPTSTDWGTTPTPSDWGKDKPYLWNYERITYSSGTTVERTTASVVAVWTEDGAGIDSITNYYLATSASSGVTTSTSGWTTSVQTMDETNCYLWNYERISYTQGKSSTTTTPHIIGHYGRDGEVITKVNETYRYATNNTGTRPDASSSSWQTTKPTLQKGYWLYTETTIHWSNNTETVLYTSERNPNDGAAGQSIIVDGSTVMKYYVGSSNTTHPAENSSDWKDLDQVTQTQGMWLWSKSTTYYRKANSTSGSHDAGSSVQYNVSYIAEDGDTPEAARGVESVTEYYKATNSSSPMSKPTSDSGWDTDPNLSNLTNKWGETYKYLWNYEKVTYNKAPLVERTIPQILAIWTKDGNAGKGIDSITNYYLINNSSTAPSRPSTDGTGGWSTTPTPPNSSNPYLWNYEKIVWLNPSSTTYTDVQMIGHYGKDGTSPYVADLDNEMDGVPCTYGGVTTASYDKYINVSLWYGSSPETLTKLTTSTAPTNVTLTSDMTNKRIRVQVSSGKQLAVRSDITITVASANSGDKTLHFILNGVRGGIDGTPATIYDIVPSLNEVSVGRGTDNSYTPRYNTLQCGYKRSVGSDISTVIETTGNIDSTYRLFFRRHKRATASVAAAWETTYYYYNYSTYKRYLVVTSGYSTSGLDVTTYDAVEFLIYKNTSNNSIAVDTVEDASNKDKIADKETVSVISDGVDGTSPIVVDLTNENDAMVYDEFGALKSGNVTSEAKLYVGSQDKSSEATWTITPTNCTLSSGNSRNIVVTGMSALTATVTASASYGNGNYTAILSLKKLINEDKYELDVTPVSIGYNSTTNSPSSQVISVSIWKVSHVDGSRTRSNPPSGYAVRLYKDGSDTSHAYSGSYSDWVNNPWTYTLTPLSSWSSCLVKLNNGTNNSTSAWLDYETIPIAKTANGANGTSPYIADLDNEMDSVACDKNGKVKASTTCGTNVSLFYGSFKRSYKITGITKNGTSTMGTGVTVKVDDSTPSYPTSASQTHTVSVTYATTATISGKDDFAITIQDATDTSITRVLHFTINGVREGANGEPAIIFRLNPSASEVVKKKDGTYIPAKTSKVTCAVLKTTGSETSEEPIDETDDYVAKYKLNGTGSEVAFPTNGITVSDITSKLEIFLYNADSSILLDKETIPLVEDGTDGTSPYFADLDNEMDSIACTSAGAASSSYDKTINVNLWHGSTPISLTSLSYKVNGGSSYEDERTIGNVKITPSKTNKTVRIQVSSGALVSRSDITITIAGTGSGNHDLHFILNPIKAGDNGTPATIFSLLPSTSSIKKNKNGTLEPTSPMTCDVRKVTGNSTPTRATSSDGTLYYKVDGDITSTSTPDISTLTINTGQAAYTSSNKYITFAFFKGTTLLDKERVPIVYDGDNGENGDTPVSVYAWNISSNVAPSISGNAYPPTGWSTSAPNRPDMAVVLRNNFTTSNWNTYGTAGHVENWSSTSSIRGSLTTGSWFVVFGKATDGTKLYHTLLYQCDNTSGDLHGVCMAHYSSSTDNNEYFLWESQSWRHKSSNGTLSYDTWGSPFRVSGDTGQGGLSIAITPSTLVVNTDENGVTEAASQDFTLKVYKGKDEVPVAEYTVTHSSLPDSDWTWTGLYYNAFRIQCASEATFETPTAITVTVALSSGGSIQTSVLLVPNKKGADGASPYSIDLTNDMDAIQYADDVMAGSSVTTTAKLYCGTRELELTTDYTLSYSATGCTASRSGQVITVSALSAERGYVVITATLVSDNTKKFSAVFTVMRLQNKDKFYIQTDKQVIPINTDTTSSSTTFPINIKVYRDGINPQSKKVETSLVQTLSNYGLYMWAGAESPRSYVTTYSSGYTYNMSFYETNVHIYITDNATFGSGTILDHEVIPSVRVQNGQQGIQGKMGRTPYYWGEWSDKESTDTFTVNDYMTPYVANGETGGIPQCWIFVGANGSYTKSTAGEPSNSSENWQLMTSDFEYLITKAIFSDFAKLGSGIFNGDFMFSQYGTYDGNTNSNEYNRFTPEVFNEPIVVTSSNKTIQTSEVQLKTNIRLVNGAFYRVNVTFESVSANSTFYLRFYRSGVSTAAINWSGSITTTTKTFSRATVNTDGSGYWGVTADNYIAKAVVSTGNAVISSVVIEHIDFNPNLSIDWLNGIIRANTGWFKNVTVEGVMNNLIQEITSTNYTNYGVYTSGTNTDAFWLNTAKVGSIIRYKYTKPLGLPSAYANAGEPVETYLCDSGDGTHQMTLNELRQCIGKKIYVLTDGNTGMARIRVGKYFSSSSEEKMLLYNDTWYYAFSSNTTTANWLWVFECKMGERNGRECIYWELLASHNKLPDNLAF